jgi:eukaryotic-like serine/threonine-protein kinase
MATVDELNAGLAGRYEIEREIGAGGMATVYLAADLKHERSVAIKVLHPELGAAIGGDRFLSEIKTTAKLQHPHILPLLDSGAAEGLLYYVMPYIAGETLRGRLTRERQLPIDEALRIAREIADALGAAHALGIVHRDVKPENILLQGGHALVTDFGIALAVQHAGGARMTQTGLSLGTPQYMSPEQAMGEKQIDARADIYALGAVTYEMLAGEPPFTGNSVQAIVSRVITEDPRPLIVQRKTIPDSVESAVLRALEKLPADRFSSAADFVAALDERAPVPRRARAGTRVAPRRRLAVIGAGAAVVALALAAGWVLGRKTETRVAGASWNASVLLPDSLELEPLFTTAEGIATIAVSPDGSQLAFVGRRGTHVQLFVRRMSDFAVRALDGTDNALAPFFSPRGDAVDFFADGQLKRITLTDGSVSVIARNAPDPWGGAWLPDGRLVFSRGRAFGLIVASATGDSLRRVDCPQGCSFPEALNDGHRLLASSPSGLEIVDVEKGTVVPVRRWGAKSDAEQLRGVMGRLDGDGHLIYAGLGGQVFAAPFDERTATLTGPPVTVAEGVRVESGRGAAQLAVSRNGTIAYAPGVVMSLGILVRANRAGKIDTIPAPAANYNALDVTPDGRRIVARVGASTGDPELEVIDPMSGRVSRWLTGASFGAPQWMLDGQRVMFTREGRVFAGRPDVSDPPQPLPALAGLSSPGPMLDSATFFGWRLDTLVIAHTDGRVEQRLPLGGLLNAISDDGRWTVAEEGGANQSAIVAHALDGSGRRVVLTGGGRFAMVGSAKGAREFIVADAQRARTGVMAGREVQGFHAISYDPSNKDEPFGQPRFLFSAPVADFPGRNYAVGMGGNLFVFKQHVPTVPLREIRVMSARRAYASSASGK